MSADQAAIDQAADDLNALRPRLKAYNLMKLAVTVILLDLDADERVALLHVRPRSRINSGAAK